MTKYQIQNWLYVYILRPFLFKFDSETIHDRMKAIGELLENHGWIFSLTTAYRHPQLVKTLLGITFENPIGLAVGFDYDGNLAKTMKYLGFGFNTIGTVTAQPYEGNPKPRLIRLIKSKSILVNKGFKSSGAVEVAKRLGKKNLHDHTIGISIGSTNIPEVNTIDKAIEDYLFTFRIFKDKSYVKYFELNISCPNTAMNESFSKVVNLIKLLEAIKKLHLQQPIFIKMPNEINQSDAGEIVRTGLK